MFDLFVPFLIGTALGISPESSVPATEPIAVAIADGSNDAGDVRVPEPQTPTGKYTTALEVKPILGMTKSNWVAVRNYEGQDFLYFTHLLAWRCGMWDIRFGVNGSPATEQVAMEPCHEDLATPNALVEVADYLPYVIMPPDFVQSVYVEITFDDGSVDFAQFDRGEIQIP